MATLKLDRELGEMAKQYAPFMTPTSPSQKNEINAFLERLKTEAPTLLDTPAAHKARALPDRVSAEPPSLPNQPARPAPRAAKPVLAARTGPLE